VFDALDALGWRGALAWHGVFGCHGVMRQRGLRFTTSRLALCIGPTHELGPDRVGRQHEHPTRVYPVVVHQRPPVRLQAAEIESLDFTVKPPIAEVPLR
jgi:hypothetical protein